MLLHTPLYLLFLGVVLAVYWTLPWRAVRKGWLLAASYAFYAAFDWRFAVLLGAVTLTTYLLARRIPHSRRPRRLAWAGVLLNLGVLAAFKYAGFFLGSLAALLQRLGAPALPAGLALLLPIGVSFYIFQAISYIIEVYRGKLEPLEFIADFALYLAFFPKLIAGPFVRPAAFLAQVQAPPARLSRAEVGSLLGLLLIGLFKKIVIADALAGPAEVAFRAAAMPGSGGLFATPLYLQGFYLYACYIYADFSGYTDLARASAGLLGFRLPDNFQQPYLAATLGDFWNRWHMSLTQWFREYLYFPISRSLLSATGRRWPQAIQTAANLITMLLIGLWHGAAWTYLAWGLWHGLLLTVERLSGWKPAGRLAQAISGVITFHLVCAGWVLFRSTSFAAAGRYFQGMLAFRQMGWLSVYLPSILVTGGLVFGLDLLFSGKLQQISLFSGNRGALLRRSAIVAVIFLLGALTLLRFAQGGGTRPFIYGQF